MGADLVELLRDVVFYLGLMTPACFEDLVSTKGLTVITI
jgi:hypothetical protein